MEKTTVQELSEFGQSIWIDNISRQMISAGKLQEMIRQGLRGMTSNPTIFDKAISQSNDYDAMIMQLCRLDKDTFEIYDELTVKDVQDAADIFLPVYKQSLRLDGYVSLEVDPRLAYNTDATIQEANRLFKKVARPNVMFKIPATTQGLIAAEELIASGVNINITLIFSLEQYIKTANAYIKGIKRHLEKKADVSRIHCVASVFVSRLDTSVDSMLTQDPLKGKAAQANCGLIYNKYLETFSAEEFRKLQKMGANPQRVLWASTSTKNPAYSDVKYVTELIAKDTVNTMPEQTFKAFLDHGKVKEALNGDISLARDALNDLKEKGIDINAVCSQLLREGLSAFEKSFDSLLNSLEAKKDLVCK
jgi:transaldolase